MLSVTRPYINAGSVGLPVSAPTDAEKAIMADPLFLDVWRADSRVTFDGWVGRKAGKVFQPYRYGLMPSVQRSAAYSDQKSLLFGAGPRNGEMILPEGIPAEQSYSIVYFGRPGPADNAIIWGNGLTSDIYIQITAAGVFSAFHGGASGGGTTNAALLYEAGPHVLISSYDAVANRFSHDLNLGAVRFGGAAAVAPANDRTLHIGARGSLPAAPTGPMDHGDLSDFLIIGAPILSAGFEAQYAKVAAYLDERYIINGS